MKFLRAGKQVAPWFFSPFLAPATCSQLLITHLKAALAACGEDASTSAVYLEAGGAMVGLHHRMHRGAGQWEWAHTSPLPCRSRAVVLMTSTMELPPPSSMKVVVMSSFLNSKCIYTQKQNGFSKPIL